jgi:hypothetical protein
MQYLIIDAAQDATFGHKEEYGGASVGCWIKNQTRKNAYLIAKGWIEDRGWVVLSLEEQCPVSEESYRGKAEAGSIMSKHSLTMRCSCFLHFRSMRRPNPYALQ